jgi:hypothetical protein
MIRIRINPRIKLIPQITRMRSRIRASHTTIPARTLALNTNMATRVSAMIHIAINPWVQLVREVRLVVARVAGVIASSARAHSG